MSRARISSGSTDREASAGRRPVHPGRRAALVAGLLFIVADVAVFAGDGLIRAAAAAAGPDYLTQLSTHTGLVAAGVLAKIVSALAGAGIAVAMYPVMKRASGGLALGSVVFRTLEAAFYMVGAMSLLALLELGQRAAAAHGAEQTSLQAIGESFVSLRGYAAPLLAVFAFCVGAFLYNLLFFRSRLVPRWLSGFGIAAIILMGAACVLSLFSDSPITGYVALAAPIAARARATARTSRSRAQLNLRE